MSEEQQYPRGSGDPSYSQQHVFTSLGTAGPFAATFNDLESVAYSWRSRNCGSPRLWRVQSRERGIVRPLSTLNPQESLTRKEVEDRLADRSRNDIDYQGQLPLRLSVSVSQGTNYQFRLDANQSVEVYASCVIVDLLASSTFALVAPPGTHTFPASIESTGIYYDALVDVDIQMIDSPLTQESTFYTQNVSVIADTQATIPVPERATSVEITTEDNVSSWGAFIGDPTATDPVQTKTIAFSGGAAEFEIGNETMLQTDSETDARAFRLRWRMKP